MFALVLEGMLFQFFTRKLPLAPISLWRMTSLNVSAMTSTWICHDRSDKIRYMRKMYMEPTRGKVGNNLTFRKCQASQKVGIPVILKTEFSDSCKNEVLKCCDSGESCYQSELHICRKTSKVYCSPLRNFSLLFQNFNSWSKK